MGNRAIIAMGLFVTAGIGLVAAIRAGPPPSRAVELQPYPPAAVNPGYYPGGLLVGQGDGVVYQSDGGSWAPWSVPSGQIDGIAPGHGIDVQIVSDGGIDITNYGAAGIDITSDGGSSGTIMLNATAGINVVSSGGSVVVAAGNGDPVILGSGSDSISFASPALAASAKNKGSCTLGTNCNSIAVTSDSSCVASDSTDTTGSYSCNASVSGTTLTVTGHGTDHCNYLCFIDEPDDCLGLSQ